MKKTFSLLLISSLLLSACGERVSLFGRAQQQPASDTASTNPLIPQSGGLFSNFRKKDAAYAGTPFEQVTGLTIERVPGGVIIRATGLAARQGIYAVQLTPENEDEIAIDGVLTYRLEGMRPRRNTPVGTVPTREVTAARAVTDQTLLGVRAIRVVGLTNALIARR